MDLKAVQGLEKVTAALRAKAARYATDGQVTVVVGYTASYALQVHENREMHHAVGRAGFLLDVFREVAGNIKMSVETDVAAGKSLAAALLRAGLLLQAESQRNCPVRTGNLRNSAYTRLEHTGGGTAIAPSE